MSISDVTISPENLATRNDFTRFLQSMSAYELCQIGSKSELVDMDFVVGLKWRNKRLTQNWNIAPGPNSLTQYPAAAHKYMTEQLLKAYDIISYYNSLFDNASSNYDAIITKPILNLAEQVTTFNVCLCYFALICATMGCTDWPGRSDFFETFCVPTFIIPGRKMRLATFVGMFVRDAVFIELPFSYVTMARNPTLAADLKSIHPSLTSDLFTHSGIHERADRLYVFFPSSSIKIPGIGGEINVKGFLLPQPATPKRCSPGTPQGLRVQRLRAWALENGVNFPVRPVCSVPLNPPRTHPSANLLTFSPTQLPVYITDKANSGQARLLRAILEACKTNEDKKIALCWALEPSVDATILKYDVTADLVGGFFSFIIMGNNNTAKVAITTTRLYLHLTETDDLWDTASNHKDIIVKRSKEPFDETIRRGETGSSLIGSRSTISAKQDKEARKWCFVKGIAAVQLSEEAAKEAANLDTTPLQTSLNFLLPSHIPDNCSLINKTDLHDAYKAPHFEEQVDKFRNDLKAEMTSGQGRLDKNGDSFTRGQEEAKVVDKGGEPVLDTNEVQFALSLVSEVFGIAPERIRVLGRMLSCQHCVITIHGSGIHWNKRESATTWDQLGLTRLGATAGSVFRILSWGGAEGAGFDDDASDGGV